MVKYPNIKVNLVGVDGNAFSIMGVVSKALRQGGVPKEEIELYMEESMSGDYSHLMHTAFAWVDCSQSFLANNDEDDVCSNCGEYDCFGGDCFSEDCDDDECTDEACDHDGSVYASKYSCQECGEKYAVGGCPACGAVTV